PKSTLHLKGFASSSSGKTGRFRFEIQEFENPIPLSLRLLFSPEEISPKSKD
ncbi:hypothetical protein CEXT_387671, partial [Caerostris extrusa]